MTEIWFISVLISTVFAGVSNFAFKIASHRGYNAQLFSLYGGLVSVLALVPFLYWYQSDFVGWWIAFLMLFIGSTGALNNIVKVLALRHIDTSLYFPLYKTLTPALAIGFGVFFFQETFTTLEWIGLVLGLLVPIILIQPTDRHIQNNLITGLWFVVLTSGISAVAAALNKYATELSGGLIVQLIMWASIGVTLGSLITIVMKRKPGALCTYVKTQSSAVLIWWASVRSLLITASMGCMLYAYTLGAPLAIANTIQSFYFLIPIILSVIFYGEKLGPRRVVAILLCLATLALFA